MFLLTVLGTDLCRIVLVHEQLLLRLAQAHLSVWEELLEQLELALEEKEAFVHSARERVFVLAEQMGQRHTLDVPKQHDLPEIPARLP
jgi:hypothetical protein